MRRRMTKLVYIGGYGHSGSTLLEYLMSGSPAVLACGEVASATRKRKRRKCTCGYMPKECHVWGSLHAEDGARSSTHPQVVDALIRNAGAQYPAIVDSSKTAWGALSSPFRLRRRFGENFFLVHLTRQPAGACWSVLKRKKHGATRDGGLLFSERLRCFWTVLGWSVANLSCELFRLIYPRQYVHLRYEDIVRSPSSTIQSLFGTVLPGIRWNFQEKSDNRHQLYGNSVRYRPLAIEDVKEDLSWKTDMPDEYARIVSYLSFLLRLRYGY